MATDPAGARMPEPCLTLQLLAPVVLSGLPLPAGTFVRLGVDVGLMLMHQRRARLAEMNLAPRAPKPPYR